MRLIMHRAASVATGTLAALGLAACGTTDVASSGQDRVIPDVSISLESAFGPTGFDTVSVRAPLQVRIQATDNAALYYAVTRVYADTTLIKTDSTSLSGAKAFDRTIDISLAGVRSGQQVAVLTTVSDGAGNGANAQALATAFDPNVPRISFVDPAATVINGGTYSFDLSAVDTTGLAKLGFRATGGGINRADSTLFFEPLPKVDTVQYLIAIAASAAPGTTFNITPFAENRDGLRATGEPISVRIVAAGPDQLSPLVYQTVAARLETPDSIDIFARDADGLVRVVGFVAKDQAGNVLHRAADTLTVAVQQVSRRKAFKAPITLRGRSMFITAYAIDQAGRIGYAVPQGATVPQPADSLGKRDPVVYAYGLTYPLPAGSLGADIAVDTARKAVFVSNINKNQLEAWNYSTTLSALPPVAVGAGMALSQTRAVLARLRVPVEVTFFHDLRSRSQQDARYLLEQYAAETSLLEVRSFDPVLQPAAAARFEVPCDVEDPIERMHAIGELVRRQRSEPALPLIDQQHRDQALAQLRAHGVGEHDDVVGARLEEGEGVEVDREALLRALDGTEERRPAVGPREACGHLRRGHARSAASGCSAQRRQLPGCRFHRPEPDPAWSVPGWREGLSARTHPRVAEAWCG